MSSTKSNPVPPSESVHDVWLRQRTELEYELFDGWKTITRSPAAPVARKAAVVEVPSAPIVPAVNAKAESTASAQLETRSAEPQAVDLDAGKTQHAEWIKQANELALQQRIEHQRRVEESLTQQREAFFQDLARLRLAFEQELAAREAAWTAQRDQEWTALQNAKEAQEVAQRRLKEELSTQRVREREELMQWRQQGEAELAEAHRLFEQERLQQQQEFARQRQLEMSQLRQEREQLDARVRQVQSELATARQRQEDDLRHVQDAQAAQMRAERAELDKLRETWLEKFRREQVVLENGLQFFGQHLSRVSDELRVAQRGLQAVSQSATEAHPASSFDASAALNDERAEIPEPPVLSLEEIHERLNQLRQPQRNVA